MRQLSSIPLKLWTWLGAKQLSDVSAALNVIVISVYALELFDDPTILGFILALKMIGSVVGAFMVPFFSRIWSNRSVLVVSDCLNGGLMICLALASTASHPTLLLILPFFMGMFHGTSHVALYAQIPHFLGRKFRYQLNSILASMDGVSVVAGGILAGFLYGLISVKSIFALDGATFLLSALVFLVLRLNRSREHPVSQETASESPGRKRLGWAALKPLFGAVGVLFLARFIEAFGSSTHNVGFPIISAEFNSNNQAFLIGWIMAIWGGGKIAAMIVTPASVGLLRKARMKEAEMFVGFLILTLALFLGVFLSSALWLILAFSFLAGVFDASTETVYYSILQHSPVAPADQLISVSYFVERVGMGAGILITGYAFSVATVNQVSGVLYISSIGCAFCLLVLLMVRRKHYVGQHS